MKSFSNSEFTEKCGLSNPTAIFKFRLNLLNISSKWESVDQTPQLKQRRKQTALIRKHASKSTRSGGDHPEDADLHVSKHHAASPASSFFFKFQFEEVQPPRWEMQPLGKSAWFFVHWEGSTLGQVESQGVRRSQPALHTPKVPLQAPLSREPGDGVHLLPCSGRAALASLLPLKWK